MTDTAHTPTPWSVDPVGIEIDVWDGEVNVISDGQGNVVAFIPDNEAAEQAVRAVNSHEALVEALADLLAASGHDGVFDDLEVAITAAAALALARGGAE